MSDRRRRRRAGPPNSGGSFAGRAIGTIFNTVFVVVAAMLIYRGSVLAYQYGIRIFGEPPMSEEPGQEIVVMVADGKDFEGIAEILYQNGLVRDATLFRLQELLSNYAEDGFQEGTYKLSTAMTPDEMMDILAGNGEEEQ